MKRPSITTTDLEEAVPSSENTHAEIEVALTHENATSMREEANPVDTTEDTKTSTSEEDAHTEFTASEEPLFVESSSTSTNEQPLMQEPVEIAPVTPKSLSSPAKSTLEHVSPKRPSFMKRFFGRVWGS